MPRRRGRLSRSLEDCLRVICTVCEERGQARVKDVAEELGIKSPSALTSIKKLAHMGLVEYERRRGIRPTRKGEIVCRELLRRREIIKRFLTEVLGIPGDIAEEDACKLEHCINPLTTRKLAELVKLVEKGRRTREDKSF